LDFNYNEEQQMLFDSVDRFGHERFAQNKRIETLAGDGALSQKHWHEMAELGWLMIAIPEEAGGLGGGMGDVMAITEAMGKHLVHYPFVATSVLAPALLCDGSDAANDLLDAIGKGEARVASAFLEATSGYDLNRVAATADLRDGSYVLCGEKCHVEDGGDADWFLISARTGGGDDEVQGISLFLVSKDAPGLIVERFRSIDGHRHARLKFDQLCVAQLIGDADAALPVIERGVEKAICAHLAEAMGSMEEVSQVTLEHLRTREQFGRPIGSFQVLQHRMADMKIACEEARAIGSLANVHEGDEDSSAEQRIAAAKVRVSECGLYVGRQAVQLHGGLGFSDELIVSHHFKRLYGLSVAYGSIDHHRKRYVK
jgi:alkylation response protein AidB-like acyl-CoA dehydrogenase